MLADRLRHLHDPLLLVAQKEHAHPCAERRLQEDHRLAGSARQHNDPRLGRALLDDLERFGLDT